MRKRVVSHVADTVFWYLLYFLPVLAYLLFLIAEPASGTAVIDFMTFFESLGLGFVSDNVIISSLSCIFGTDGVFPIFSTDVPFVIFTWFIGTYILHLAVDFILFIPRFAHKWLNKLTNGED